LLIWHSNPTETAFSAILLTKLGQFEMWVYTPIINLIYPLCKNKTF